MTRLSDLANLLACVCLLRVASSFAVFPGLSGGAISTSPHTTGSELSIDVAAFIAASVGRSSRSTSWHNARRIAGCSMSTAAQGRSSTEWERFWSSGLNKGDLWDTGIVSPALQKLLDEGKRDVLSYVLVLWKPK